LCFIRERERERERETYSQYLLSLRARNLRTSPLKNKTFYLFFYRKNGKMSFGQFKDLKILRFKDWADADIFCILSFYWHAIASRGDFNAVRQRFEQREQNRACSCYAESQEPAVAGAKRMQTTNAIEYLLVESIVAIQTLASRRDVALVASKLSERVHLGSLRELIKIHMHACFCFSVHHLNFVIC
jgi:hypothetical protein